ncbi:ribonuclease HII [Halogranum gelatinilyticum]|uniref:ribonuclease HII n=1 Tax=Halogranum gelatinilyticum TaxID=660521 RepID=UPI000B7C801A|nr:ribonuclease HII [Halogranum gelatinilyticum]
MHVGADEAGKGPVLGPMVAAAVRADSDALPDGIDDSKRVKPARRTEIAETLRRHDDITVGVGIVPTEQIDDPETDMNSLTVAAQVEAVASVAREGDTVVVDAGDVSEARFGRRVREGVSERADIRIEVVSEHGADESHAIVGAASIVAKVERDRQVENISEEYADYGPVGSGYPSDPKTREFLKRYVAETGDVPACARRSWSTCADLLAAQEQSSLGEF